MSFVSTGIEVVSIIVLWVEIGKGEVFITGGEIITGFGAGIVTGFGAGIGTGFGAGIGTGFGAGIGTGFGAGIVTCFVVVVVFIIGWVILDFTFVVWYSLNPVS